MMVAAEGPAGDPGRGAVHAAEHEVGRVEGPLAAEAAGHVPAEEPRHEGVRGPRPHLGRRAHLGHPAGVHHHHPVGEPERLVVVVGHEHHRLPQVGEQGTQLPDELVAQRAVERAERLVEHQEARLGREARGRAPPAAARHPRARPRCGARTLRGRRARARRRARASTSARPNPCMRSPKPTLPITSRCGNSAWSWNMSPNSRRWGGTRRQVDPVPLHATGRAWARVRRRPAAACSCPSRSGRAPTRSRRRPPRGRRRRAR